MSDQPTERVEGQFYIDIGNKIRELEAQLAECEKQLAAEREKWMALCDKASDNETKAAARAELLQLELVRMTQLDGKRQHKILQLEQQLAAERVKLESSHKGEASTKIRGGLGGSSPSDSARWTLEWALSWIPGAATPVQRNVLATGLRDILNDAFTSEHNWSEHIRIQLAAEVEKVNKLQKQLDDERESLEVANNRIRDKDLANQQLRQQIAAEREKREGFQLGKARCEKQLEATVNALAAEREKNK